MTHRSTWKKEERKVSKKLGGERNPLSGGASKHTTGDVIHNEYYVEVKMRKKLLNFFKKRFYETIKHTIEEAKNEGKKWMVVFREKYSSQRFVILDFETFLELTGEKE